MSRDVRRRDPLWPWDAALIVCWLAWAHFQPQEAYPQWRVLGTSFLLAALLGRALVARRLGVPGLWVAGLTLLFFALPIWGWIASRTAVNPPEGILTLGTWFQGSTMALWASLAVLCRGRHSSDESIRLVRMGLIAVGLVALAIALWGFWGHFVQRPRQIVELERLWDPTDDHTLALLHNLREERMRSSLGDPNHVGFITALGTIALACGACWAKTSLRRGALGVGCLVTLAALTMSGSRAGQLSLLGGAAVLLWPLFSKRREGTLRRAWPALAVVGALAVAAVVVLAVSPPHWLQRLGNTTTARERLGYWAIAWNIFITAPITGQGVGGYVTWYPSLRPPGLGTARFAHCLPLQLLAETGIIGLLAASLPLWPHGIWRRGPEQRGGLTEGRALAATFAAVALNSLVGHSIHFRELWLDSALLLGLAAGWRVSPRADAQQPREGPWAIALATVALAIAFLWPAEIHRSQAELLGMQADALLRTGRLREGLAASEEQVLEEPDFDLWRVVAANRLLAAAPDAGPIRPSLLARAESHLRTALGLNPLRPSTHATLARMHRERGDLDRAVKAQREAVRLHPAEPRHHTELARLLLESGDSDGAEAAAHRALDLHPTDYDALLALGEILLRREDFEEARDCAMAASESSELNRRRPEPWHLLSRIEFAAGDVQGARAAADEALRRHPGNPELIGWRRRLGED